MVPPAIRLIYCHLRWQDGSLWRWPLTDLTLSRGRRIELGVTPPSDIRIYLRGGAAVEEVSNSWIALLLLLPRWREGGCGEVTPRFVSPQRRETCLLRPTLPGPPSARLPHLRFPPFHSTSPKQNTHGMWRWRPFPALGERQVSYKLFGWVFQHMVHLALWAQAVRLI